MDSVLERSVENVNSFYRVRGYSQPRAEGVSEWVSERGEGADITKTVIHEEKNHISMCLLST